MDDAKQQQMDQMDKAADDARSELELNLATWKAEHVASWWKRWYMRAGHKRLGRVLINIADRNE